MSAISAKVRLNKRSVDSLEPLGGKRRFVWDSETDGFGCRVEPSGRKTFIVRYRTAGGGRSGVQRQATLGAHGVVSVEEARKQARALLGEVLVDRNADPVEARRAVRQAETVAQLVAYYLDTYAPAAGLRRATVRDAKSVFTNHVLPGIGTRKVQDLAPADIRRLHADVRGKVGRYQANRVLRFTRKALSLAVENGWREDNPASKVKAAPEDKRERYFSDDEVRRFLRACDEYADQNAADALRLLLYTGARLHEVLDSTWDQFDLSTGVWTKPSAHTKQKRTHRLELAGPALDLLNDMRARVPFGRFLFPGDGLDKPRVDLKRPWTAVKAAAQLENVRLHDLRHTLASHMITAGAPLAVVGKALGHTQAATTARYAHVAESAQREATRAAGLKFVALANAPQAEVISFSKPRESAVGGN